MKKKFLLIFASLLIPFSLIQSFNSFADEQISTEALPSIFRPYVLEINNPDGSQRTVNGTSANSDSFFIAKDLGFTPHEKDKFSAFPEIKMAIGSKITIFETPEISIKDGKKTNLYRSWSETVSDLLAENDIELGDDDRINFSGDTKIFNKMNIIIVRVAITTVREYEPISYKVIKKEDKTLDEGKTRIDQKGVKGEKKFTYEVRREDGVQISKKLLSTEISKEPVDEIKIIGTKPVITVSCGKRSDIKEWIIQAATANSMSANTLCCLMMQESMGNANSTSSGGYKGLFQYEDGYWNKASSRSGFSGASIFDAKAQIFTTASEIARGEGKRWPPLSKCK